jgi:hypothetical protein
MDRVYKLFMAAGMFQTEEKFTKKCWEISYLIFATCYHVQNKTTIGILIEFNSISVYHTCTKLNIIFACKQLKAICLWPHNIYDEEKAVKC